MRAALGVVAVLGLLVAEAQAAPTAEDLYAKGRTAFDAKQFHAAVIYWRDSFALSQNPKLLFNLAQAYRLSGNCEIAVATYKKFVTLDSTPAHERDPADEHTIADGWIKELEPTCRAAAQKTNIEPSNESGRNKKIAGLVAGGSGIALFAIGLGLGKHASTLGDEVTRACSISCEWAVEKQKDAAGRRDAKIGYALDAVGIAAIVGGAVLYYMGHNESAAVTVEASARNGGATVSWSGSW